MKKIANLIGLALAAAFARADVTSATEWQDVPPDMTLGAAAAGAGLAKTGDCARAVAAETKAREDAGYLTAESDPEFAAWKNGTSIALGFGAAASGDSSAALGFGAAASGDLSVALGFGAYATNGTMGIVYAPDQINLCSINSLPNPGSTARSLQSYLDERATTNDLAAVKASIPVISATDATFSNAVNAAACALVKAKLESLDKAKSSIGETIAALQSIYNETEMK